MSSISIVVTDYNVFVYQRKWRRQLVLCGQANVDNNFESSFESILGRLWGRSCRLIVDRSDEEYSLETLPLMSASVRRKAIKLRSARLFPDREFLGGAYAGKTPDGSHDRVLCFSLENKPIITIIEKVVEKLGMVFTGVYSAAVLIANQTKRSQLSAHSQLVISSRDGLVWRYSLVTSGLLILTRCVVIVDKEELEQEVVTELKRTLSYAAQQLGESESLTTLYLGPELAKSTSPSAKLLQSMSRRFRLFDSSDIYRDIIAKSHFWLLSSNSYHVHNHRKKYKKYVYSNSAIATAILVLVVCSVQINNARERAGEFAENSLRLKGSSLQAGVVTPETGARNNLQDLPLADLQKVVEEFSKLEFNHEAREIEHRIALALAKYQSVTLYVVSFTKPDVTSNKNEKAKESESRATSLTAVFNVTDLSVAASFLAAVVAENLNLIEKHGFEEPIGKKGVLGKYHEESDVKPKQVSITVTLALGA